MQDKAVAILVLLYLSALGSIGLLTPLIAEVVSLWKRKHIYFLYFY